MNTGGYRGIEVDGEFLHYGISRSPKELVRAMTPNDFVTTNSGESVFAIVRRQFMGTHHWWSKKHTWLYMDEISFLLNQGNCIEATVDRLQAIFDNVVGKWIRQQELSMG